MRSIATRSIASLALAGILVGIGGCADQPTSAATPSAAAYHLLPAAPLPHFLRVGTAGGSAVVGPEGGVVTAGGATLTFPAGALSQSQTITVTPSSEVAGVSIEPHGLVFPAGKEPVLTLPYDPSSVNGVGKLNVVYVVDGAIVEVLPTTRGQGTLTTRLPHFSLYAGAQG